MALDTPFAGIGVWVEGLVLAKFTISPVSCCRLVATDCQTVDSEESGDPVDHEECPMHVHNKGERKVEAQVQ